MEDSSTSLPEYVTLIIRASNQHTADHTIQCGTNWSIRNLKDYLSEVYPSKPKREDQKLIYSGQLLADNIVLKDVLRTYEGQENHTVHLVCKTVLTKEKRNKTETKKDRVTTSNVPPLVENRPYIHSTNNLPSTPYFTPPQNMPNLPDMRYFWPATTAMPNNAGDMYQQLAMMHQAYNQYVSQYMQAMGYLPVSQQINARDASQMPNFFANPNIQLPRNEINDNVAQPQQVQNNHRARNVRDDPDDDENRDWLDWFYTLSRVLVLFSIVYFYSSPMRFFFVSTLALLMYLYHIGFFNQMGIGLNNNNNNNNNNVNFNNNNNVNNVNRIARDERPQRNEDDFNNNGSNDENSSSSSSSSASSSSTAAAAAASATRQNDRSRNNVVTTGDEAQIEQEQVGPSHQQSNNDQQAAAAVDVPERPSPITLAWLILRSFFLSIIPDHQNVI